MFLDICRARAIFDKKAPFVAPAVEQVPQLYSPLASSIASQWYSAIAE
jgi:hypothetical protein